MMKRKILVTGSFGFLGQHVSRELVDRGVAVIRPTRSEFNLLDFASCSRVLSWYAPDTVIHLAATVGGIGANQKEPGRFFYENALMGMNLIEASRLFGIKKFVQVGTVCSYPSETAVPFSEEDLWRGYPEPTNAPYGIAKKILLTMLQAYRQQYGMNGVYLIPANLYGPGDNCDPDSSHVIPAIIRKVYEAYLERRPRVTLWGTGRPTREFLYVEDAAQGIVTAALKHHGDEPVNLGGSGEVSISSLAGMIAQKLGYEGKVVFDGKRPDGQLRRKIDTRRAKKLFGWKAGTSLDRGLSLTIRDVKKRWVNL